MVENMKSHCTGKSKETDYIVCRTDKSENFADGGIRLKIIEYFTTEKKEYWLNEIKKCDWGAGQYLYQLLCENNLKKMVGETALVPMLVEEDRLIAFCTFAPLDDIQPTNLSPWIGFLYTFPGIAGIAIRRCF